MTETLTPLNVAFIWHMHQPEYKDHLTGEYLMPWVRLHGTKDYLDMVQILEQYPRIKQTFNLVPILIDQIQDYTLPETHDRHMTLALKKNLSEDDKRFILARFFDAAPHTMIAQSTYYSDLLERRNAAWQNGGEPDTSIFTESEYADLTALFHLVWFDPMWLSTHPRLVTLWDKQHHYTLDERAEIIGIQRELIQQVLPTYKAFQDKGQIEVTTTPYYHPILPLLIDSYSAKIAMPHVVMPEEGFQCPQDALFHVTEAQKQYQQIFGQPPKGMWPAEQSISPEAAVMIKRAGIQWAVSSEGNLSYSLNIPFEKDPYGNIINVDVLCQPYQYEGLNLIFRHLTLSDLIGFHYASMPPEQAAADLVHRIKEVQRRCTKAGIAHPILTIALDGENCWESFPNDGHQFLRALYQQLSDDTTLNICRVCDYFETLPESAIQPLSHLHSGSWINSNFHIWIGDPVKNAAWMHLKRTRNDLEHLSQTGHYKADILEKAWREIYIAEGSDWFWWYGEPHNSGQDDVFDMQFRRHLANVYRLLDIEIPNFLNIPLSVSMGRPVTQPIRPITPLITGKKETLEEWSHAGCFDLSHGAMHRASRILNKVYYGSDSQNLYLRFDINSEAVTPYHELYLYFCTPGKTRHNSPIRLKSDTYRTVTTQRYHFAYELILGQLTPGLVTAQAAEAIPDHLWMNRLNFLAEDAYEDILEVALPFDELSTYPGEYIQFSVAMVQGGILQEFQPDGYLISVHRPELSQQKPSESLSLDPVHSQMW